MFAKIIKHKTCYILKTAFFEKRKRRQRNLPPEIMRKLLKNIADFASRAIQKKKRQGNQLPKFLLQFFPTKRMIISGKTAELMKRFMGKMELSQKRMISCQIFLKRVQ